MEWRFHDLQDYGRRGTPALQAIRDFCTKYNVNELADLVEAHSIIAHWIESILKIDKLTDQLAEMKETCFIQKKKHEKEVTRSNILASQRTLLHLNTADTLPHASGTVASSAASIETLREEVCKVFEERDELRVKWEQGNWADEDKSISAKKVVEEMPDLLAQARDVLLQLKKDHEEKVSVGKGRNDSSKALVTDPTGQMMRVEELLCSSRSKKRMALAEVKTPDALRRNVLGHLRTLLLKKPGLQERVAEDVKDEFSAFSQR